MTVISADPVPGIKVAVLPGLILYGGVAFLALGNSDHLLLALPAAFMSVASVALLRPLIRRYCEETESKFQITTAFRRGFFRFYLSGRSLWLAYAFNYSVGLAVVGFYLFLWIHALG